MKYWFIFIIVITTLFGGLCIGAIDSSQKYLASSNINCASGNSFREKCNSVYFPRKF